VAHAIELNSLQGIELFLSFGAHSAMSLRSDFGPAPDRKIPSNGKYQGVQTRLDTGASASKRPPALPSNARAHRLDEEFKRIRAATLSRMIQEDQEQGLESVFNLVQDRDDMTSQSSVMALKAAPAKSLACGSVASIAGSVLSVIDSDTNLAEGRKLVLLDLREPEEYERCRVPFAISYPAQKINRDQFIPELHKCKRDPSKLLVVYHTNDNTTSAVATLLVRKGWDTVYALSGGFDEMVCSYSEVLEGEIPDRTMSSRPTTGSTVRSASGSLRQSASRLPGEIRRGASYQRRSASSGRSSSPRSVAGSIRSTSGRSISVK